MAECIIRFEKPRQVSQLFTSFLPESEYIKIPSPGIGIHLDNWNRNTFFSRFDGIGIHLFWDKWNLESNYYQEYKYISFFAPESESNHPLGEIVTSPRNQNEN